MAGLKIFVSSTCYDMHSIRAQLRTMLGGVGYEPVMSDQADVIYDPRIHTHSSCLREVENCDAVVVVIGSRFGGNTVPKALEMINLDGLSDLSRADKFGEDKTRISITQAEVLRAIQVGIPIFAFVDSGVMRDHLTYEKNKNKIIISEIEFSSIDKSETAPYIFEFINFLRLRNENNSIFEFSRFEDIDMQLKKQWSGLFQRLLHEQRTKAMEGRRIDDLSSQIADLKAAVMGSISSDKLKGTAKGAIRFRHLVEFLFALAKGDRDVAKPLLLIPDASWSEIMRKFHVAKIIHNESRLRFHPYGIVILLDDETYFKSRIPSRSIQRIEDEWEDFRALNKESKNAIVDAVLDGVEGSVQFILEYRDLKYTVTKDNPEEKNLSLPATIFLSADKLVEETIKKYLLENEGFEGMNFTVEAGLGSIKVTRFGFKPDEESLIKEYRYYNPVDGDMSGELVRIKNNIFRDFARRN